jgi:hygromycin-B 4-O-kinase
LFDPLARSPNSYEGGSGCDVLSSVVDDVPNVRGVIHGDLLLNHLIAEDNSIAAVFDWGNSLAGDPLYDAAWILFCIPWFPAIDGDQVVSLARSVFGGPAFERRLAIYQLHIAVSELQYLAHLGDAEAMRAAAVRTTAKIEAVISRR